MLAITTMSASKTTQQIERFRSGEFRVQAQFTRQIPQVRGRPAVIGDRVQPEHPNTPAARPEQAGQAPPAHPRS
ncbi:hypothetical protein [Streptomyces sp. KS 21]|uniref:hypothetical protein n=1 Tax=Streptomyces sp. KS 21 TaxID=2485150 RepID=UPI0010644B71|nr:hypothetical protein [Streptomyces sp. KS 21]TDU79745.1 hypothetical protein EDD91_6568 [Streptomyces sp. KS 21]